MTYRENYCMENVPYSAVEVGKRLRKIRAAHGLSQSAFAAQAGISASALANWEQGQSRPSFKFTDAICNAFDLTSDYIYFGKAGTLRYEVFARLNRDHVPDA